MAAPLTHIDLEDLRRRYLAGESVQRLAFAHGVHGGTIERRLKSMNIPLRGITAARRLRARNFSPRDLANLCRRYLAGETQPSLALRYGVDRGVISRHLRKKGIHLRGIAEANLIRMRNLSAAERQELTAAAHEAVRGKRQSPEHQAKIARTREIKQLGVSPIEIKLIRILRARGLSCTAQKAVGRYNVDVAINSPPIAVEIFGGGWHAKGRAAARFRQRTNYLLYRGWTPVFIWVLRDYPLQRGAIDYVVALAEKLRRHKTATSQEHVIRGDGQPSIIGKKDFDKLA